MISFLVAAAASAASSPIAEAPLRPWAALVGHCWSGPAPGEQGTDRHCFESVYGGQHIRDRHVVSVSGRDVYAGEAVYSAKGHQVIFTYWNSLGGLGTGTTQVNGDDWRFSGTMHATATSEEVPLTARWKIEPNGFVVIDPEGKPRLFGRAD